MPTEPSIGEGKAATEGEAAERNKAQQEGSEAARQSIEAAEAIEGERKKVINEQVIKKIKKDQVQPTIDSIKDPKVKDSVQKITNAQIENPERYKEFLEECKKSPDLEFLDHPEWKDLGFNKADVDNYTEDTKKYIDANIKMLDEVLSDYLKKLKENGVKTIDPVEWEKLKSESGKQNQKLVDLQNKIDKSLKDLDFKKAEKNAKKGKLEKIKKDGIKAAKDRPSNMDSLKTMAKWLTILAIFGGVSALFMIALSAYAEFHSGCQFISCLKDEEPTSQKVWCFAEQKIKDGVPEMYSILNFSNENLFDYNSSQCTCPNSNNKALNCSGDEVDEYTLSSPDNSDCCVNNSSEEHPQVSAFNLKMNCLNDMNSGCPFAIYYWGIMTPLDAAGNIGNGLQNYVQHGFKWLVKLLVIVGVVVGVIILLLIVYQYFKNKHPAQAIKVESGSAISKFGNSSYFGNLSRYSNYAYMGRCAAFPAKPYVPLRFKF